MCGVRTFGSPTAPITIEESPSSSTYLIVSRALESFPFVLQTLSLGQLASSLLLHLTGLLLSSPAQFLLLLTSLQLSLLPLIQHRCGCGRNYLLPVLSRNLVHPVYEPNISRLIHVPELLRYHRLRTKHRGYQCSEEDMVCSSRAHTLL